MPLHTINHPVAQQILTRLRDKDTNPTLFRTLCHELTVYLAVEATRDLPTRPSRVETPLESTMGVEISKPIVVVAILRAGMGMVQKIVDILPDVSVGFIGLERDEETAQASAYYCKLPPLENACVLVVDPMLATGGTAIHAVEFVSDHGATDIRLLSIVAAPEGVDELSNRFPDLNIFTVGLDRQLNTQKYIQPGLGDFGDRLYGT